jgi:methionyl-tRNA formyltransferase
MKIVIMMSRVNYVPENYRSLLEACLQVTGIEVVGLLLVNNCSPGVVFQGLGLMLMGAPRVGFALLKNTLLPDPKIALAHRAQIPLLMTRNPNSETTLAWLHQIQPDLILHMRTRCILGTALLRIPKLACINIHHGLLPETRGTLCDLRLLVAGHRGGFSLHRMVEKVDKGEVYSRTEVADAKECQKNYGTYLRLSTACEARVVANFLKDRVESGQLPRPLSPSIEHKGQWFRTPGYADIRAWRKAGWKL